MKFLFGLAIVLLLTTTACSPVGMATGAAASVGIASQTEEGLGGTASDIRIKILISDLWFRYSVEAFGKLSLTVQQGRVLITGIVQNPDQRVEAVRLAWQVEGVKQVINEIRVADSEGLPGYVHDKWISTRIRTALTSDAGVYSINYSIETVQGNVYLMGIARSQAELDRVIEIARTVPGVLQVISYITLAGQDPQQAGTAALTGAPATAATTTTTTTTQTTTAPPSAYPAPATPAPADGPPGSFGSSPDREAPASPAPAASSPITSAPITAAPLPPPVQDGAMLPP
jgi:osmotically-inducible protein OsmY